jgi:hypothetical protein
VSFDLLRTRLMLVERGLSDGLRLTASAPAGSIDLPVLVAGSGARKFGQQASSPSQAPRSAARSAKNRSR